MESDDDVLLSSPLVGDSPPVRQRKLKRLKKAIRVSLEDRIEIEDLATGAKNSSEFDEASLLQRSYGSEDFAGRNASESRFGVVVDDGADEEEEGSRAKRALNFGSFAGESDEIGEDLFEETEEEIADLRSPDLIEEEHGEEKIQAQKNKRKEMENDDGEKIKEKPLNKRRLEKERQENLKQLFAESQRLLRETRDASFKPAPIIKKPISSVLEKIRKRKLELSKKYASNRRLCSGYNDDESSKEFESGNENESNNLKASNSDVPCTDSPCKSKEFPQMATNEESKFEFRAPNDDTQDLFSDSQTSDSIGETPSRPSLTELIAPSRTPFNLQLDSEPPEDVLSDEDDDDEDYDKENIDPSPRGSADLSLSPTREAVRTFVDEEAEEEDDSDKENDEDEDEGDIEDLKDMIATGFKEKPIDSEKRNELHQKWLEQQDADGTENLLQKLKQGSKTRNPTLIEEEEEEEEEEEDEKEEERCEENVESGDEGGEDLAPLALVKMNLRKAKQMMAQVFNDDDEGYVSSSDGEETEEKINKQYLVERAKKKASLFSQAEDESSREVFGRIKKLNVAPENKKRAKTQSYFDMSHMGVNRSISSKSSFLGRGISASMTSSKKQGSMAVRSFIFERDDSNSKSSSISASAESTETVQVENRHRTVSAKFVSSQTRTFSQNSESAELRSKTSLLDMLKRSSFASASKRGALENVVPQTESILASFKLVKKPLNSRQARWS